MLSSLGLPVAPAVVDEELELVLELVPLPVLVPLPLVVDALGPADDALLDVMLEDVDVDVDAGTDVLSGKSVRGI